MRKHSFLRALTLAALLAAPLARTALAGVPTQQAMTPTSAATQSLGLTGPYDMPVPTVGD
ncbi:MAG: hypothetical protein ACREES_04170 [Stellaceae bacterium]